MPNTHLAYPNLASNKFSDTDLAQHVESFVQFTERKINFALGDTPVDPNDCASYNFFGKKALFSIHSEDLQRSIIENATTWAVTREHFTTRFSDERNKFPHKLVVEHCL